MPIVIVRIPTLTAEKIAFLVDALDTEVGWFGTAELETTERGNLIYTLNPELLIYPQMVTGATVSPDDEGEAYDNWWTQQLVSGKRLTWHGHSHCRMGTSPSGTDNGLRSQLNQDGGIHIYTIHNKQGSLDLQVFSGTERVNAIVQHGNNDVLHEDILEQLHLVRERPIQVVWPKSHHRGNYDFRQGAWGGIGYNEYDEYIEREAEKPVQKMGIRASLATLIDDILVTSHGEIIDAVEPDVAESIDAQVEEYKDVIDNEYPELTLGTRAKMVNDYRQMLMEDEQEAAAEEDCCPLCGCIVAEDGTCPACGARKICTPIN